MLTIRHNGQQVLRGLTGIPSTRPCPLAFPGLPALPFPIMSGTNVGGSQCADPVAFVSCFNDGPGD